MSKSRIKQSAVTLLFATAVSLMLSVGCSKQGEGERCDHEKAGDSDCDDGLVCVMADDGQDRCCPPSGAAVGDSRCQRTGASTGGQGNSGGSNSGGRASGGSGGTSGETNAGAPATSGGEAGASTQSGGQSSGGEGA